MLLSIADAWSGNAGYKKNGQYGYDRSRKEGPRILYGHGCYLANGNVGARGACHGEGVAASSNSSPSPACEIPIPAPNPVATSGSPESIPLEKPRHGDHRRGGDGRDEHVRPDGSGNLALCADKPLDELRGPREYPRVDGSRVGNA